ncbi:hypothetical protein HELRODRAFT_189557 [Helobdella robusta]|uniref:Uncharacterized protein n=1 Tax=Helobdella robusta TaxID=6412 RepID=T1FR55_HELRO|nr:hypothetical protein HELRODRAFT_189557 [Helobdella robusta]ESN92657.1 hypothetical protein HELRODRAFT_189557 [Helobdella robusta]
MSGFEFDDIDSPRPMKSKLPISNSPHNTSQTTPQVNHEKEADDLRLKLQEEYKELNLMRNKLKNEKLHLERAIRKLKSKEINPQGVFQMNSQPTASSTVSAASKKPAVKPIFPGRDTAKKPQNCSEDIPYVYVRTD